jgi:hypothetical protein
MGRAITREKKDKHGEQTLCWGRNRFRSVLLVTLRRTRQHPAAKNNMPVVFATF